MPPLIYKFRRIDGEHLENIIRNQTLYFANPLGWNDPFDGQLRVDTKNTQAEVAKFLKANQPVMSRAKAREFGRRTIQFEREWHEIVNTNARERISKQGLCCFTGSWQPILQWSYYADGHKGVALGFDPLKDPSVFAMPLKVNYVKEYPFVNYVREPVACLSALLTAKSEVWAHEQEIRMWRSPPGLKTFESVALREVIFGARATEADMERVQSWCQESGLKHVEIFKAYTAKRSYTLERKPV